MAYHKRQPDQADEAENIARFLDARPAWLDVVTLPAGDVTKILDELVASRRVVDLAKNAPRTAEDIAKLEAAAHAALLKRR